MRLSIRLQNHGKRNHPYWWIVVAPQHKNIFGRFTEHIGFWSPRHNVNIKRQIILNLPKLMYWIGNGAVPTYKVHKFLYMYGILPKPWQYIKSAAEVAEQAKKQKPYQQMTPKQKSLVDRRRKREQREALNKHQYHRYEAYAMRQDKLKQQIMGKHHDNQFENEVIRDMLYQTDFQKYDRLAALSGDSTSSKPIFERLKDIKQKLRQCKSSLALLEKQYANSKILQKSKLIQKINDLMQKLNQVESERVQLNLPVDPVNSEEYVTEDYLSQKLKYELITKKIEKTQEQMKVIDTLFEPITISQYADKLKQLKNSDPNLFEPGDDVYQIAESSFLAKGDAFSPMTRFDLLALDPQYREIIYNEQKQAEDQTPPTYKSFIELILKNEVCLPSLNPVHPRPDLKTYIPQQHYDPIDETKLDIMMMDSLEPHEQLQKYLRKRDPSQSISQRKKRDSNKRMERLRLLTEA